MQVTLRRLGGCQPKAPAPTPARCAARRLLAVNPLAAAAASTSGTGTSAAAPSSPAEVAAALSGAVPAVPGAAESADQPFYSQYPLDRKSEWRRDGKRLDELFARPDAKLIPLLRDKVLVRPAAATAAGTAADASAAATAGGAAAALLRPVLLAPASSYSYLLAASPARPFLGLDANGAPYFAVGLRGDSPAALAEAEALAAEAGGGGAEWRGARLAGPDLAPGDASLLAVASGLLVWHAGNSFGAASGSPMMATPGGFSRKSAPPPPPPSAQPVPDGNGAANSATAAPPAAAAAAAPPPARPESVYPRIDPAVIMLITSRCGQWALLGRKQEWPTDRYSTLAGFLDLGEPLEAAVVREVAEEAGVAVDMASVTYAASQPWPFPRSLMVGFFGRAAPATSPAATATAAAAAAAAAASARKRASRNGAGASSSAADGNGAVAARSSNSSTSTSTSTSGESTVAAAPAKGRAWWQPPPPASSGLPEGAVVGGFDLLPVQGRRAALDVGVFREEVDELLGGVQALQWPVVDEDEMEDVRWFHRDWVRTVFAAPGGALSVSGAGKFNVPGPYSLAFRLITAWAGALPGAAAAKLDGGGGGTGCAAAGQGSTPLPLPASFTASAPASAQAAAAAAAHGEWEGDRIPQVLIGEGTFKYVLARLWDPRPEAEGGGRSKLLVWGDPRAPYHNDVLQKAKQMAQRCGGLKVTVLGGGRIRHDPATRSIDVYGYSAAFGPAPHELAAALLARWHPLYDRTNITVSYDGY
ncbi:hypothetical protein HYH02_003339 [Chlamydomonas schloesseri]|uniref:NAD(+) diphosphatase n=1 Tax=Chlamydomonas schloesseri TaxID=2026947 RepID=A0A836BAP9_9CHLO|nr:hypothetical protein HYH02_003339 [Chlamydomonas schloesseri]|eukprot:KAG2452315.1 hypothetical protein HYH02_003339 [Chlamydomonas schloesseri]